MWGEGVASFEIFTRDQSSQKHKGTLLALLANGEGFQRAVGLETASARP